MSGSDSGPRDPRTFPLVLAGPSGSGKTTIAHSLVQRRSDVRFSVSATTRPRRPGEQDGVDYHFLGREEFRELGEGDGLLEWAEVHGELYGTPRSNLEEARAEGRHLLLDIDVQGARSVRKRISEAVTVFVLPPAGSEMVRRLRGRGTEERAGLLRRVRSAEEELGAVTEFDYLVVNDDLDEAVSAAEAILEAEMRRIERLGPRVVERMNAFTKEVHRAVGLDAAADTEASDR